MDNGTFHVMRTVGKTTLCGQGHPGYGSTGEGVVYAAICLRDYQDGDRHMDRWRPVCGYCKQIVDSARMGLYRTDGRLFG